MIRIHRIASIPASPSEMAWAAADTFTTDTEMPRVHSIQHDRLTPLLQKGPLPSTDELIGWLESCWHEIRAGAEAEEARPGSTVGFVGIPHDAAPPVSRMFADNVALAGGMAPVRHYLPDLIQRVLDGWTAPGRVFDRVRPLAEVAEAYADMDQRRATKVLLRP